MKHRLYHKSRRRKDGFRAPTSTTLRISIFGGFIGLFVALIIIRLFILQVIDMSVYRQMAFGAQNLSAQLDAVRGEVFMRSVRDGELSPLILNEDRFLVFADGRRLEDPFATASRLAEIMNVSDEEEVDLKNKMSEIGSDPYEPLFKSVSEFEADKIRDEDFSGIGFVREPHRYYPESVSASHLTGFTQINDDNVRVGQYGLEGYFDRILSGQSGTLSGERDPFGAWIPLSERSIEAAKDGPRIITTIDPAIQKFGCDVLIEDMREFEARSATLIVMNPETGEILAMCNVPHYDPNNYRNVDDISVFNNSSIFTPYEPGSVFKPITMAAALDTDKVEPQTTFYDEGFEIVDDFTIRNAAEKKYGLSSMREVLVESINTGVIFAARKVGRHDFAKYVEQFGFGRVTGLELDSEVTGTIENVYRKGEVFLATASFGQGITSTPMQLIMSYSVLANHGKLLKPTIIHSFEYADGSVETFEPQEIRQVVSSRTASQVSSMLASVIEDGHSTGAGVDGYLIGGKTGTAQIADESGGYGEEFNHTFIGYGPADDAKFVMLVKFENPNERFAASTAVPTFGKIAAFLVEYLELVPDL